MPRLQLVTAPSDEPLSLTQVKDHLHVTGNADDDYLRALITAARLQAEASTHRALMTQTWDWFLDDFPSEDIFCVPRPPLQSITSITYLDAVAGATQTWATTEYDTDAPATIALIDEFAAPGRIALAFGVTYPATRTEINSVTVRFVAGYGADQDVPAAIRQGMLLAIGSLYEHREDVVTGTGQLATALPMHTSKALWWPYRLGLV